MVNVTAVAEWFQLSDCNVTHWFMVLLGCVAAMSEGMGVSKRTRHNGLLHLIYNIATSKCCCPTPVPMATTVPPVPPVPSVPTVPPVPPVPPAGAAGAEDTETTEVELTSKDVTRRVTRSSAS